MSQDTIKCPKCGEIIKLSEAISHDMEISIKTKLEKEFEGRLVEERKQLQDKAKKAAIDSVKVELSDLKEQVAEKNKKLEESQKLELELRKRERQISEKEENLKKEYEDRESKLKGQLLLDKKQIEEKVRKEVENSQNNIYLYQIHQQRY